MPTRAMLMRMSAFRCVWELIEICAFENAAAEMMLAGERGAAINSGLGSGPIKMLALYPRMSYTFEKVRRQQ